MVSFWRSHALTAPRARDVPPSLQVGFWGVLLALALVGCAGSPRTEPGGFSPAQLPPPAERIVPGDRIEIQVATAPEWNGRHDVPPDGTLQLGLGLTAQVAGLTRGEASQAVTGALATELRSPEVTLTHQAAKGAPILVLGLVPAPGEAAFNEPDPTLGTVLAQAFSGPKAIARNPAARLVLIRPYGEGRHAVVTLGTLANAARAASVERQPRLAHYDILVVVPPSAEDSLATARQLAEAGLTERFRSVHGRISP